MTDGSGAGVARPGRSLPGSSGVSSLLMAGSSRFWVDTEGRSHQRAGGPRFGRASSPGPIVTHASRVRQVGSTAAGPDPQASVIMMCSMITAIWWVITLLSYRDHGVEHDHGNPTDPKHPSNPP